MFDRISSILTVILMGAVLVMFEMGQISPRDAFFVAASVVIIFTGQQFISRENMGFIEAAKSIVVRPQSYRSRTSFAAYVACLVLGLLVTAQVMASA
jgi:cytochrome c biogenesis protein CcdA